MARRKNVKRIDPRYFLNETVNRDINTGEALDEEREAPVTHWVAGPGGLVDQHGDVFVKPGTSFAATRKPSAGQGMMVIGVGHGTSTERWFGERPVPYEDVQKHRSNSNYKPPQPGPEHRPRRGWNETIDRGEEELEEGWGWRKEDGKELDECGEMGGEAINISAPGTEVHVDDISQLSPEEAFAAGMAAAKDAIDQVIGGGGPPPIEELEETDNPLRAAMKRCRENDPSQAEYDECMKGARTFGPRST